MRIYIDDERIPKTAGFTIIRSFSTFINLLKELKMKGKKVSYISFDHDLGMENGTIMKTGMDCAKALIDFDIKNGILDKEFNFNVHSANPSGAENIQCLMNTYMKFISDGYVERIKNI